MAITIRDVARAAGVSVATVSRVLNGSARVEEATRRRVEQAAADLGYTPNASARSLIRRKTDALGVVMPYLTGEFFPEVIRGLDQAAQERAYCLLFSSSHNTPGDTEKALRAMHGRVDGLILMSPQVSLNALRPHLPPDVPVVLLNCEPRNDAFSVLSMDNYDGAYQAVAHLAALGHVHIAHLAGETGNYDAGERRRGYRDALADAGLRAPDAYVLAGDFSKASGLRAGRRLAALDPRPTAVFAANDYMALGALRAFADAGLAVPDDVALVGFDDIPSARYMAPPLTTVHAPTTQMGRLAAEWLMAEVEAEGDRPPRRRLLDTHLVVRASCAAPA